MIMKNHKWTKGPWVWGRAVDQDCLDNDLAWLENDQGERIMDFGNSEAYYPSQGLEPSKANANLIAAAPTHDDALCMVYNKIDTMQNIVGGGYMITLTADEYAMIRDTLRKARGES